MVLAALVLSTPLVVVVGWSTNLNATFIISDVLCTTMMDDEYIGSFLGKEKKRRNQKGVHRPIAEHQAPVHSFLKHNSLPATHFHPRFVSCAHRSTFRSRLALPALPDSVEGGRRGEKNKELPFTTEDRRGEAPVPDEGPCITRHLLFTATATASG